MANELVFLEPNSIEEEPFTTLNQGFVYVIDNGSGLIKIGRTKNLKKRIKAIESQSGKIINRVYISKPCTNYGEMELKAHEKFKDFREIGEWFRVSIESVAKFIETLDIKNEEYKESDTLFKPEEVEFVKMETEILESLINEMDKLRFDILVAKKTASTIPNKLIKKSLKVMTLFDNFEVDFKQQISCLMELGKEYKEIKLIIEQRYALTA